MPANSLRKTKMEKEEITIEEKNNGQRLDKFLIEQKRQLELQLKENNFWLSQINNSYQLNEDVTEILKRLDNLNKLTTDSIKKVADKYLVKDRLFEFILLPEENQK